MSRKIIRLKEIAELTGIPEATHRWYRHNGTGPKTFLLGGRVVAFEDDVTDWIDQQARTNNPVGAA